MKRYVIFMTAGVSGTENAELIDLPEDITQAELDALAWDIAKDHAESYGFYPVEDAPEKLSEDEELEECYTENIDGWAELYDPEIHDGMI